jgi:hypothetical protein
MKFQLSSCVARLYCFKVDMGRLCDEEDWPHAESVDRSTHLLWATKVHFSISRVRIIEF